MVSKGLIYLFHLLTNLGYYHVFSQNKIKNTLNKAA